MNDVLYLKIEKNTQVNKKDVRLADIAELECANQNIVNKLNSIKVMQIPDGKHNRFVISVIKIMELIHKECPTLQIDNLGEADFITTYKENKNMPKLLTALKVAAICLIIFCGSGFSIMAFNQDASVAETFKNMYRLMTGVESDGFTLIELMYAAGLSSGIIIFYNHFGEKKITKDPTPIEVEMRLYEDEVNTALIEIAGREQSHSEVR